MQGDISTGRKNRIVPGLGLQEGREQLSLDSAQWLGQRVLEASQPRLSPRLRVHLARSGVCSSRRRWGMQGPM